MSKPLKVGFIGAGGQAMEQIKVIKSSNFVEISSVCDINAEKAQNVGLKYNIPFYTNYEDMIKKEQLDVVFICLPHNLHKEATIFALSNNLHVIKEKPFALTVNEGEELVQQARRKTRSILTIMQRRGHHTYILGKKLMNEIGEPFLFRVHYSFNGGPYDFGWRGKREIAGGGAILDMGYHMLDLIIWYFGIPTQIFTQMTNVARPDTFYDTEDSAVLTMKKGKSLMGNLVLTRASQPKDEQVIIHGTKGTLKINRQNVYLYDLDGNVCVHITTNKDWTFSTRKQIDAFAQKILNGQLEDSSSHMVHLKLLESAYQSERLGRPVHPSLAPFKFLQGKKEVL